jgi:primosomal protein N' (replication factor Y)
LSKPILNVALDIPLDRLFDYLSANKSVAVGQRVLVPFGKRSVIGVVISMAETSEFDIAKLKPIVEAFSDKTPIDTHLLKLIKFSAEYYQYPYGQALLSALPARLRQITPAKGRQQYVYQLSDAGLNDTIERFEKRQKLLRRVFEALQTQGFLTEADIKAISTGAKKAINQLIEDGLVVAKSEAESTHLASQTIPVLPTLNDEQSKAVADILAEHAQFKAWLLHGITGSGKTEVYMQLMQAILQLDHHESVEIQDAKIEGQILVLVPEINLTPQLEGRFQKRFPHLTLVSLHSNLSESERLHHWQLAQSGKANIVIGTRLSVFTPLPHLKMIIIDEEHDGSYKQQDSMRYHARDIALVRAKRLNIPIILGSATPSLESWFNVSQQKYALLSLRERAVTAAQLPEIDCIDTTNVNLKKGFTPQLIKALKTRIERGEQSLLFINRRGYSPVLLCSSCNWIAPCTRCSARLVVHLGKRVLRCHHCGHEQRIVSQCPDCGDADLHPTGHGTQRLEETLQELLPNARIARVDRDSISKKGALVEILDAVHANQIDILIGTQMLAKGHDFPNLTLVGVIDTDGALHSPDFRASERLFAQLMQVSGRAGRADKKGQVLIQTQFPFHELFNALRIQDYVSFANAQLEERELIQFPPYIFTALLRAEATDFFPVSELLNYAFEIGRDLKEDVTIYEPVRPQMERVKGMERAHVLMQAKARGPLQKVLRHINYNLRGNRLAAKVRWSIDVDPLEF